VPPDRQMSAIVLELAALMGNLRHGDSQSPGSVMNAKKQSVDALPGVCAGVNSTLMQG
jgi:hypothetical protein